MEPISDPATSTIFTNLSDLSGKVYTMTSIPRGTCIIINNTFENNTNIATRAGTDTDREELTKLFKWLDFTVIVKNDLKESEITRLLSNLNEYIEEPTDCFVCCILTHGNVSGLIGSDGVNIRRNQLKEYVSVQNCPKLKGKPKIFIVQACRGKKPLNSISTELISTDADEEERTVPLGDIYIQESTVGDYRSYRHRKEGSFFIKTLCEVFRDSAKRNHLNDMILQINQILSNYQILSTNGQIVIPISDTSMNTMKYNLYFNPRESYFEFISNSDTHLRELLKNVRNNDTEFVRRNVHRVLDVNENLHRNDLLESGVSLLKEKIYENVRNTDNESMIRNLRLIYGIHENHQNDILANASYNGNADIIRLVLKQGAFVNRMDYLNRIPLYYAAASGNTEAVKLLLDNNSELNAADFFGLTPLHNSSLEGHLDILKLLVNHGADINAQGKICGRAPLHNAVIFGSTEAVKFLIHHEALINIKDSVGRTPLHLAAMHGEKQIVQILVDQGADIDAQDLGGFKAIHFAQMVPYQSIVNIIRNKKEQLARLKRFGFT